MPKSNPIMQSWQVFHYARKHLGRAALYAFFGKKNARAVDYWCEDPQYTEKSDTAYDPIHGVKRMFAALDDRGHIGVIKSCIGYLTSETSIDSRQEPQVVDLLPTLDQEVLADYRAVCALQTAIERGDHPAAVSRLADMAIAELERTSAKYHTEFNK